MGCVYCSHLPKQNRIITNLKINSIWSKKEGWEGCAEAQFYENGEMKYNEWTCCGIKSFMNEMKKINYYDIQEIIFQEQWIKKSQTNGNGQNPLEDPYLYNVCYIKLKNNNNYLRLSPITEDQVNDIKIKIFKINQKTNQKDKIWKL